VLGGSPTDAGMAATQLTSLNFSAGMALCEPDSVWAALCRLQCLRQTTNSPSSTHFWTNPHPRFDPTEFWKLSYVHRTLWNFYAQKIFKRVQRHHPVPHADHAEPRDPQEKAKPTPGNPSGSLQVTDDVRRTTR